MVENAEALVGETFRSLQINYDKKSDFADPNIHY